MKKHVDTARRCDQIFAVHGIAADRDRTPFVIDAIAESGRNRFMVHAKGGDFQIGFVYQRKARRPNGHDELFPRPAKPACGDNVRTVMGDPIGAVDRIYFIESGHHTACSHRARNRQRLRARRTHPGLQQQFTHAIDVVGVKMGQEHALRPADGKAHAREFADAARADIENEGAATGQNAKAWAGAIGVRHGRARPTNENMQAIRQPGGLITPDIGGDRALKHVFANFAFESRIARKHAPQRHKQDTEQHKQTLHWKLPR